MTPDLLPKYFMPFSDTYENDRRGSYIFSKKGETSRSVMLEAHVDELGFMTNYLFIWIPAGVCLLLTVLGFNFVGDGLRDAFDPKMKR